MKAAVGDRMVVAAGKLDGPIRDGEILRTGPDGAGPYLIRWSDSGHETLFFPGADAHVEHYEHSASAAPPATVTEADEPDKPAERQPEHTRSWHVDIYLYEKGDTTNAQAVLHGDAPTSVTSRGVAHRRPGDPSVPEIGDEVAVARALRRLANRLLNVAEADIGALEGHPVHLNR